METNAPAVGVPRLQQAPCREGETAAKGQEEKGQSGLAGCRGKAAHRGRGIYYIGDPDVVGQVLPMCDGLDMSGIWLQMTRYVGVEKRQALI